MPGWLNSLLNWGIGGVKDLWNKVINVVSVVYSYVDGLFNAAISDINAVYKWISHLVGSVENWTISLYNSLSGWVNRIYGDFQRWVSGLWSDLISDLNGVIRWATQQLNNLVGWALAQLNRLVQWVIQNIWNPLYNAISGAINWIGREGYWAYYMVTHPDQLAAFIAKWVFASWVGLGRRYSSAMGRWLMHTMLAAAHDVAGILEDILASII